MFHRRYRNERRKKREREKNKRCWIFHCFTFCIKFQEKNKHQRQKYTDCFVLSSSFKTIQLIWYTFLIFGCYYTNFVCHIRPQHNLCCFAVFKIVFFFFLHLRSNNNVHVYSTFCCGRCLLSLAKVVAFFLSRCGHTLCIVWCIRYRLHTQHNRLWPFVFIFKLDRISSGWK